MKSFYITIKCGNLSNVLCFSGACVFILRHCSKVKSTIGYIPMFSLVIILSRFLL